MHKQNQSDSDSEEEAMNDEVYLQMNISAQECDSDDLEGELNLSDDES